MMFLVFMLLYMGVLHKVHTLVEENVMKREAIETRYKHSIQFAFALFFQIYLTCFLSQNMDTASRNYRHMQYHRHGSVFYFLYKFDVRNFSLYICIPFFRPSESCNNNNYIINMDKIIDTCTKIISYSIQGFIIIIVYIVNGEVAIIDPMLRKIRWKRRMNEENTSEPIKGIALNFNLPA